MIESENGYFDSQENIVMEELAMVVQIKDDQMIAEENGHFEYQDKIVME